MTIWHIFFFNSVFQQKTLDYTLQWINNFNGTLADSLFPRIRSLKSWAQRHNGNYLLCNSYYSVQGNSVNDKHRSFSQKTLTFLKMISLLKINIFLLKTIIKKKMLTFKKINLYNIIIWSTHNALDYMYIPVARNVDFLEG